MRKLRLVPYLMAGLLAGCPGPSNINMDATPEGGGNDAGVDGASEGGGANVSQVPQTESVTAPGLDCPADVVTDHNGWRHIYACSLHDAMFVEGLMQARDRMPQMDILRRLAEGSLSEILGSQLIDQDLSMRVIGLGRVAQRIWDTTPEGRSKRALQAFTDGVNFHIAALRAGTADPPAGTSAFFDPSVPQFHDWTPVDSIALGRYQSFSLSYDDGAIALTSLRDRSTMSFDMAGTADRHARAGFFWDFYRFAPPTSAQTAVVPDFYTGMGSRFNARGLHPILPPGLAERSNVFLDAVENARGVIAREDRGSNNWVVSAAASSTGHALLANDPHLQLTSPAVFWGTHITVTQGADAVDFAGTAFPGIPAIILGSNSHVSWAATVTEYDVTDVYAETVTVGSNGAATVTMNGAQVPVTTVTEQILQGGGNPITVQIPISPHGPFVPNIQNHQIAPLTSGTQLSIHWTGQDPTYELSAVLDLIYSNNVNEARTALEQFGVGAQNFMLADADGNIGYSTHSNVPIRDPRALSWDPANLDGNIPCLVLPGTGEAEWTGMIPSAQIPGVAATQTRPFLVSANNDQVGSSFDNDPTNDPQYLSCQWDIGFRATRITERLTALMASGGKVSREDMEAIQGDHKVLIAGRYLPFLDMAFTRLTATWGGTSNADLDALATSLQPRMAQLQDAMNRLHAWETGSLDGASGLEDNATAAQQTDAIAAAIYHAWMVRLMDDTFGDEFAVLNTNASRTGFDYYRRWSALFLLEQPTQAHTLDASTGQSAVWDDLSTTSTKETRDYILLKALDEALTQLGTTFGTTDVSMWLWGKLHTLRFASIVPTAPELSIPPPGGMFPNGFPRPGGLNVVDASDPGTGDFNFSYGSGPSQRFSVNMDPASLPRGVNVLPGGEDIDVNSPHHADEAELWRRNQTHPIPRTVADVVTAAEGRIHVASP